MKNIHVLPTDKSSRLYYNGTSYKDRNSTMAMDWFISSAGYKPQNIHITSDEEIKPNEYALINGVLCKTELLGNVIVSRQLSGGSTMDICKSEYSEIILTTDQDLIKDGVQAIDDEFLEWFVKNPSCEEVEVKKEYITPLGDIVETCYDNERLNYKIIIPSEKPKQEIPQLGTKEFNDLASAYFGGKPKQETLEEAAEKYYSKYINRLRPAFIAGARWQQERMYSEEEVLDILFSMSVDNPNDITEWFEQFKNK